MTGARPARIVLLSSGSLSHQPRVLKEALALAAAGHQVQVIGAWLDHDLKAQDLRLLETAPFRFVPAFDRTLPGLRACADDLRRKLERKAANAWHRLTGREGRQQLGMGMTSLAARAHENPADLLVAHSEAALHVACELMGRGRRVGVDMEDWFSEDLLPPDRRARPLRLLRRLEHGLLTRGVHASCPSRAMSEALAREHGCRPPAVVYNAFPWSDRQGLDQRQKDRRNRAIVSVCWYSQTLGRGRGLEDLAAAIPMLAREAEFHLRGRPTPGMEEWIRSRIPADWQPRVFFHPLVPHRELLSRIAEHDIGFAGETPHCRSRDLTVTNKILHYLVGGLAVVASDTAGQREVAAQAPGAVALYPAGDPRALAHALDDLISSPERLANAKAASLRAAETTFCWERQQDALLDAIARATADVREGVGSKTCADAP